MKKNNIFALILSTILLTGCGSPTSSAPVSTGSTNRTASSSPSAPEIWTEKLADGGLKFVGPDQVSLPDAAHEYGRYTFAMPLACDWQNTTSIDIIELRSSDASIIPNDNQTISLSNEINTSTGLVENVAIDIKRANILKAGTVFIKAHLKSANVSSEATIVKKLKVVPFGEVTRTTYHETLKLDWSALTLTDIKSVNFQISDGDFEYGLKNPNITDTSKEYQDFWQYELKDETTPKKDITFSYFEGHRYGLIFQVSQTTGTQVNYEIANVVGEGSATTGFNQYKNYYLSFVKDNSTLALTVTTKIYH